MSKYLVYALDWNRSVFICLPDHLLFTKMEIWIWGNGTILSRVIATCYYYLQMKLSIFRGGNVSGNTYSIKTEPCDMFMHKTVLLHEVSENGADITTISMHLCSAKVEEASLSADINECTTFGLGSIWGTSVFSILGNTCFSHLDCPRASCEKQWKGSTEQSHSHKRCDMPCQSYT